MYSKFVSRLLKTKKESIAIKKFKVSFDNGGAKADTTPLSLARENPRPHFVVGLLSAFYERRLCQGKWRSNLLSCEKGKHGKPNSLPSMARPPKQIIESIFYLAFPVFGNSVSCVIELYWGCSIRHKRYYCYLLFNKQNWIFVNNTFYCIHRTLLIIKLVLIKCPL